MKTKNSSHGIRIALFMIIAVLNVAPNLDVAWAQGQSSPPAFAYLIPSTQSDLQFVPMPPFDMCALAGDLQMGLIAFGGTNGREGAYMTDMLLKQWQKIADAPFAVAGCGGENNYGPIIYGGVNRTQMAYLRKYSENVWKTITDAPFPIVDMAGNNGFGPIVAGGVDSKKIAYMRKYSLNQWDLLPDAPFSIIAIAGSNESGVIIAGGRENRQVAYMSRYSEGKWHTVAEAPFPVVDLAGSNDSGPVIVGGSDGRRIAFIRSYSENIWTELPQLSFAANAIAGSNTGAFFYRSTGTTGFTGMARQRSGQKARDKIYKAAIVEFSERGDLGIKDAGAIVAEWITTALNQTGAFEVYERLSLDKLMQEHQLEMSGLMDDATMAQIGRMHGVQAIIAGSVIKFGDIISVTAKVVDVETAKIIDSADIKVKDVNAISSEINQLAWELAID